MQLRLCQAFTESPLTFPVPLRHKNKPDREDGGVVCSHWPVLAENCACMGSKLAAKQAISSHLVAGAIIATWDRRAKALVADGHTAEYT